MKKLLIFASMASLALAGCDRIGAINSNGTNPAPTPTATASAPASLVCAGAADTMYAIEAAYNVPAHAYVEADAKGLLSATLKARVKPLLVRAYDGVKKARLLYAAGDAIGLCKLKAEVTGPADEAAGLIPK